MKKCGKKAEFAYEWVGKGISFCCEEHGQQIKAMVAVINHQIVFTPLGEGDENTCQNEVEEE